MPSRTDREFISKLESFTNALEGIVDALKQQSEKGDPVSTMAGNMDGEKMDKISEDIRNILKTTKDTDDRTKQILNELKSSRKQKETGLFGKIEDKENKNKIVDGVGVIMLIAGGVLAIGTAFKIVGSVDFLSVVALSAGILMVSKAFAEIAQIKDLTYKKVLMVGLSIIAMSAAVVASSWILQGFKPMGPLQMFSFIIVSTGLGIGAYMLLNSIKNISLKPQDMAKYLLLPLILPAIAGGIVLSSLLLTLTAKVGFEEAISAIFVSAILAVGAIAISLILKSLGKVTLGKIIAASLMIPVIAAGIVGASHIFKHFEPVENAKDMVIGSLAMGLSIIAFVPSIYVLGKMSPVQALIGTALTIPVALAITAAGWIFSVGEYGKYPDVKWAAGVGLSLLAFSISAIALGIIAMTGLGAVAILAGTGLSLVVAASIVGVSHVLKEGTYEKFPDPSWAGGVGSSLLAFGRGMVMLGVIPFAGKILDRGDELVKSVAKTIVDVSYLLKGGDYTDGPTKEWSEGIGLAMLPFAETMALISSRRSKIDNADEYVEFMKQVALGIVTVGEALSDGVWGDAPGKEWSEGVGGALVPFAETMSVINERRKTRRKGAEGYVDFMKQVAEGVKIVGSTLVGGTWTDAPGKEWSEKVSGSLIPFNEMVSEINRKNKGGDTEITVKLAYAIKSVGIILDGAEFEDYPSKEWVEGVNESIAPFSSLVSNVSQRVSSIGDLDNSAKSLESIARAMVKSSIILQSGNFINAPTKEWAENVSDSMEMFTKSLNKLEPNKVDLIEKFAKSVGNLAQSIKKLNEESLSNLSRFSNSITIMSVIDDRNLRKVISTLDGAESRFDKIVRKVGETVDRFKPQKQSVESVEKPSDRKSIIDPVEQQQQMIHKMDTIISKFDEVLETMTIQESPEDTGKKDGQ